MAVYVLDSANGQIKQVQAGYGVTLTIGSGLFTIGLDLAAVATSASPGLMSAADKVALDALVAGGGANEELIWFTVR